MSKIAALATIIPPAVLGGATATVDMFGMEITSGFKMLGSVDLSDQQNF